MHRASPTAHNIATSKMAAILAGREKRGNRGRFCSPKILKRINDSSSRLKNCWSVIKNQNKAMAGDDNGFSDVLSLTGRRVVELNVLAKYLDGGCKACGTALKLSNCTDETVSGLGSFLYIACSNSDCGEINVCHTNKKCIVRKTKLADGLYSM